MQLTADLPVSPGARCVWPGATAWAGGVHPRPPIGLSMEDDNTMTVGYEPHCTTAVVPKASGWMIIIHGDSALTESADELPIHVE